MHIIVHHSISYFSATRAATRASKALFFAEFQKKQKLGTQPSHRAQENENFRPAQNPRRAPTTTTLEFLYSSWKKFFFFSYFSSFFKSPIISPPPPPLAPRLLPNRRAPQTLFGTAFVLSAAAHMAENESHPVALRTLKENAPFYQKHMRTPSDHFCIPLFATAHTSSSGAAGQNPAISAVFET